MRFVMHKRPPIEILLVDDNRGDAELTHEAFSESDLPKRVHHARDGEEALDFLYQRNTHTQAVRPDIILLDINMPRKSGTEVLATIKQDETLRDIPVIMLTSSQADQDIRRSYSLQANAYVVKPDSFEQWRKMATRIEDFWMGLTILPTRTENRV